MYKILISGVGNTNLVYIYLTYVVFSEETEVIVSNFKLTLSIKIFELKFPKKFLNMNLSVIEISTSE